MVLNTAASSHSPSGGIEAQPRLCLMAIKKQTTSLFPGGSEFYSLIRALNLFNVLERASSKALSRLAPSRTLFDRSWSDICLMNKKYPFILSGNESGI